MALVYACICPDTRPVAPEGEAQRTVAALRRVAEALAAFEVETAVLVSSRGPAQREAMGVLTASRVEGGLSFETDGELARRVLAETAKAVVRAAELRRWDAGNYEDWTAPLSYLSASGGLSGARLLMITTSWLDQRAHFEFGRAVGRAVAEHERRVAVVCAGGLSHALAGAPSSSDPAGRVFDEHYGRAIEAWDVKWLVGLDREFRRRAAEGAVAQTAVLMGALSGYRIQPRVLSYEAPFGVGYLVAAIDVLGRRMKQSDAPDRDADKPPAGRPGRRGEVQRASLKQS